MECMGGKEKYIAKLDSMFSEHRYWHGNEPCHQIALPLQLCRTALENPTRGASYYGNRISECSRWMSGNDDAGQMSAWYVFSAMGFYPVCPGTDEYILGAPLFKKATLHFENGKNLVITASDNSDTNRYVDEMRVNGTVYTKNYLKHNELLQGGVIDFKMTDRPNMQRGTQESDLPYSFSKDETMK